MTYLDSRPSVSQVHDVMEEIIEDNGEPGNWPAANWEVIASDDEFVFEITGVEVNEDNEKVFLTLRVMQ